MQLPQVGICSQKTRDQDHCRAVAMRNSETVVNRGGMQEKDVRSKQRFLPDGDIGFSGVLMERAGGRRCHSSGAYSQAFTWSCASLRGTEGRAEAASG